MSDSAQRMVAGLLTRGVVIPEHSFYIERDLGQAMMNKAAGEIAPTWLLRCDGLFRSGRLIDMGRNPTVIFDGVEEHNCEVCSHVPLTHILKQDPSKWLVFWCPDAMRRLRVETEGRPPGW